MSASRFWPLALALVVFPAVSAAGDYVGVLRLPGAPAALAIPEPGFYWSQVELLGGGLAPAPGAEGLKLKLGYRYSPYLSVETGYADSGLEAAQWPFSAASSRSRGYTMETIGSVPFGTRAAFYGRVGAWRSGGGPFLLSEGDAPSRPGAGLHYGLGFKVDLTRQIGLQAEMERISPLDRWGTREPDADHVSVGVTWRF
ncbi:MAG: outer membrane beta-barrel protein [Betaproteobacteria bacterium]|nr:outer membrane beta-barrel protein [Betaproteobacteria bacterium]